MNKSLVFALAGSLLVAGCATASNHEAMKKMPMAKEMAHSDAINNAMADAKAAKAAGAQWRIIDKATGGKAVNMSKLLDAAVKKEEAGEMAEADRIAAHVSNAANLGMIQAERYAGAVPYYK